MRAGPREVLPSWSTRGNGLSTSPHTTDDPSIATAKVPHVRIGDVRAQEQLLLEQHGIDRLALVVGGSMGAADLGVGGPLPRPGAARGPIAGTPRNTPHDFLFTQRLLDAITSTRVGPIEQDMFFPPRDCVPEAELTPGSEVGMLLGIAGHIG